MVGAGISNRFLAVGSGRWISAQCDERGSAPNTRVDHSNSDGKRLEVFQGPILIVCALNQPTLLGTAKHGLL